MGWTWLTPGDVAAAVRAMGEAAPVLQSTSAAVCLADRAQALLVCFGAGW